MKKLTAFLVLTLLTLSVMASEVHFYLSDWLNTAPPLTNYIRLTPVALPILANGGALVAGVPRTFYPVNGGVTNSMKVGGYKYEIQNLKWPKPVYFMVPDDNLTYNVTNLIISGGNVFALTGVQQLQGGTGVSLDPPNGKGVVTVSLSNGGTITSLSNTVTLWGNPFVFSLPKAGFGPTNFLSLKPSGGGNNIHWTADLVIDGAIHGGNGLTADGGKITGFNGLSVDNGGGDIENIFTGLKGLVPKFAFDPNGGYHGSSGDFSNSLSAYSLTVTGGIIGGSAPLSISSGGFPAQGVWVGNGAFGLGLYATGAITSAVGILAGNSGVASSGPIVGSSLSALTVSGEHFIGGATHQVTVTSGSIGSGSSFVYSSGQSDTSFSVAVSTGTAAATNDILFVTFGTAYTSAAGAPNVTFSPATADAAALTSAYVDFDSASNSGFIFRATLANSKSYRWNFHVIQ